MAKVMKNNHFFEPSLIQTTLFSTNYILLRKLPGIDQRQQMSAKIMQRSNLIIMPNVSIRLGWDQYVLVGNYHNFRF